MRCAYIHAHTGFELAHPCYCIVSKHMDARASTHTRTYIYTQHAHAHNVCTHTPITRTSAPEQHETAPRAASAAAVAAAGCMLACCCCCRWHAGMLQLLLLLHALEGDWPPSHHHFSKHPEQSNPEEHFQRGLLLPVPPFSLPARATSTASSIFLRAARNVTYILLRASRSQGSPTTDISPGSPESTY